MKTKKLNINLRVEIDSDINEEGLIIRNPVITLDMDHPSGRSLNQSARTSSMTTTQILEICESQLRAAFEMWDLENEVLPADHDQSVSNEIADEIAWQNERPKIVRYDELMSEKKSN